MSSSADAPDAGLVGAKRAAADARVATARESNAEVARRGLWAALDTADCGRPDVVREFLAALPPDQRIVDVGCWNGTIAVLAASLGVQWRSYIGIDIVPEAVAEFRRLHRKRPGTTAVEGDIRALPLDDDTADVVLCLFVLQDLEGHRADGERALDELARIARPGARGLLALTVHESVEEETFYVVKKLRREGIPQKPTHHWRRADFLEAVGARFRIARTDAFGPNERGFVELYLHLEAP